MDISDLAPQIAALLHLQPSTFVLLLLILNRACNVLARRIPNDATGWKGIVRQIASVIGTHTEDVVTLSPAGKSITLTDVAAAAAKVPPIPTVIQEDAK